MMKVDIGLDFERVGLETLAPGQWGDVDKTHELLCVLLPQVGDSSPNMRVFHLQTGAEERWVGSTSVRRVVLRRVSGVLAGPADSA